MNAESIWRTIITGFKPEKINNKVYIFNIPTFKIYQKAQIYILSLDNIENLPSIDEIENQDSFRFFNKEELDFINNFDSTKVDLKNRIGIAVSNSTKKELTNKLEQYEIYYSKLLDKKFTLLSRSKDTVVDQIERDYCFATCVRDKDNNLIWDSAESFFSTPTYKYVELYSKYSEFYNYISKESTIRKLAKVSYYRSCFKLWSEANITSGTLDTITKPLTLALYWCSVYSNTLNYSDNPIPKDVLEDDAKFDEYLKKDSANKQRGTKGTYNENSKGGNLLSLGIVGQ